MCLTEPHCGTDLALCKTRAKLILDIEELNFLNSTDFSYENIKTLNKVIGLNKVYHIDGNKIFISSGDHDLTDNIVHLVLAKTSNDNPKNPTRDISLFLVPKFLNDLGSISYTNIQTNAKYFNFVDTMSVENKMGLHGNTTASLAFDGSVGFLVGQLGKGLNCMFEMMNEARLGVGIQGLGLMNKGYEISLNYAINRIQSKSPLPIPFLKHEADYLEKSYNVDLNIINNPANFNSNLIIHQPDVRRMLLTQLCYIKASKFLVYNIGKKLDKIKHLKTTLDYKHSKAIDWEIKKLVGLVGIQTPISKSFITDKSQESLNLAMQILGGHGYIKEYKIEQLIRDGRITQIYEGTNGVQAIDLLGRKIYGRSYKAYLELLDEIKSDLKNIPNDKKTNSYRRQINKSIFKLKMLTYYLGIKARKNKSLVYNVATTYLDLIGLIYFGYGLIMLSNKSHSILNNRNAKISIGVLDPLFTTEYLESNIVSADFFFKNIYPEFESKFKVIMNNLFDDSYLYIKFY